MKIKAKSLPRPVVDIDEIISEFCLYYPQYTYAAAKRNLPYKRLLKMLRYARVKEAERMIALCNIVAGPHTKNGEGTKGMIDKYQEIIDKNS